MNSRHAVRSANRQALIAAAQHMAAASSPEAHDEALTALREALVPYADRERTMRPPWAKKAPEERPDPDPAARGRGEVRVMTFWSPEPAYRIGAAHFLVRLRP